VGPKKDALVFTDCHWDTRVMWEKRGEKSWATWLLLLDLCWKVEKGGRQLQDKSGGATSGERCRAVADSLLSSHFSLSTVKKPAIPGLPSFVSSFRPQGPRAVTLKRLPTKQNTKQSQDEREQQSNILTSFFFLLFHFSTSPPLRQTTAYHISKSILSTMGYSTFFLQQAGMVNSNTFTMSIVQYALGALGTISSWVRMLSLFPFFRLPSPLCPHSHSPALPLSSILLPPFLPPKLILFFFSFFSPPPTKRLRSLRTVGLDVKRDRAKW
jgi:hypothetical protein